MSRLLLLAHPSVPSPTQTPSLIDLIKQPAVDQHIDRLVRGFDLHCAKRVLPVLPDQIKGAARCGGAAKTMNQVSGILKVLSYPELEDDFALLSGG